MMRWSVRLPLGTFFLLLLFALPVRAASITTYGSIIITALGNDTLKIDFPDKPGQPSADPGPVPTGGGSATGSGSMTIDGGSVNGGATGSVPPAPASGSSGGGSGGMAGGSPTPGLGATGNPSALGGGSTSGSTSSSSTVPPVGSGDLPPIPVDLTSSGTIPVPLVTPPPVTPVDIPVTGGVTGAAQTPEPASLTLLALGGLGSWAYARRRRDRN